jgi:hypothetical protein
MEQANDASAGLQQFHETYIILNLSYSIRLLSILQQNTMNNWHNYKMMLMG